MGGEAPQPVGAVGGQLDLIALHGQARVQRLAVGLVVLHDEDADPTARLVVIGACRDGLAHPVALPTRWGRSGECRCVVITITRAMTMRASTRRMSNSAAALAR